MLSTPIINPPQSAILGVHATKDRAVVENGQIVVRPMNYLAMSLRPPHHRRPRGGARPGGDEGSAGRPGPPAVRHLSMATANSFDVVVIGAGPGGYIAAIRAAQLGFIDRLHRRVEERQGRPGAGRHLHQRRLHSVEGAAAVVASTSSTPATSSPTTASASTNLTHRRRADAGAQGRRREAEQRRHPLPVQEEQGHVLPRPRLVRRGRATAATRSRSPARSRRRCTAKHVIVATGSNARALAGRARSTRRRSCPTTARCASPRCRRRSASSARA